MKKLALVMAVLMAVTAVLTPSVAATGSSSESKIVYFEDFSSDYNEATNAELLSKLEWTPIDGATALFSLEGESLIIDNVTPSNRAHSTYEVVPANVMSEKVANNSYTVQMDVTHLAYQTNKQNSAYLK